MDITNKAFYEFDGIEELQVEVDIIKAAISFSQGLDHAKYGLMNHHLRVSLISLCLGKYLNLSEQELFQLFQAAILHDIGVLSSLDVQILKQFDFTNTSHTKQGYEFMQGLKRYKKTAEIIRSHHDRWDGKNDTGLAGEQIPLASRIISLADRVDILLQSNTNILLQRDLVLTRIQQHSGEIFDPTLVKAFLEIAKAESIWLDLVSPLLADRIYSILPLTHQSFGYQELLDLAELFARVVDAKSPYTYNHSHNVASTTVTLAGLLGCSRQRIFLLYIAGLLHDLGKMTISEMILDKPGPLSKEEMSVMKQHTYYTYWWLKGAFNNSPIAEWAAYHHERLDGAGYPFRKKADELDMGARIVAVSDIFSALREDRPYRSSLGWNAIEQILLKLVEGGGLDSSVVEALLANKEVIDFSWEKRRETMNNHAAGV